MMSLIRARQIGHLWTLLALKSWAQKLHRAECPQGYITAPFLKFIQTQQSSESGT